MPMGPTAVSVAEHRPTPAKPNPLPQDMPKRKMNLREELRARKKNTVGKNKK